ILTAATYEAAVALYERYRPFVFAVISDTRFPRGGHVDDEAGCRFLRKIRAAHPDMALLLMSSEPANSRAAASIPAAFLDKNHDDLSGEMEQFLVNNLGFGPFVFRLPDGREVARAAGFNEFERCLGDIPAASLLYHAARNHFSTWLMARSEIGLALRLSAMRPADFDGEVEMRHYLSTMIRAFRKWRQFGVVSAFDPLDFEPQINDFVKIGQGSMGGKATGIAFWAAILRRQRRLLADFKSKITIPQTCVIGDDGFKDFVGRNKLFYLSGGENDIISQRFLAAPLPDWLREALSAYLKKVTWPITVRSSSIMEDARYRPYAGLYRTCMLANNEPDFETRLARLIQAVKLVYASTYFSGPRKFSRLIGQSRQDSMPVIIQQVAGRDYGGWFYPAISGVAQSYNYYPISHMRPTDGVVSVALGLGHTVVEGGNCLRFSPAWPRILPQFASVDDILGNSQRQAYVLDLKSPESRGDGQLRDLVRKIPLSKLDGAHSPLPLLTSVYLRDEHRIRDGAGPGERVLTFAPILKYNSFPLAAIIQQMLNLGSEGMGCPVEMEFAVDLPEAGARPVFYLLQIRPMAVGRAAQEVEISPAERQAAFCRSQSSLGHGVWRVRDLVLVDQNSFEVSKTRGMVNDISRLNSRLTARKRPYLLIGPGRWGSADSRMGIPVRWEDISGAAAIVEVTGGRLRGDPSQGTHFFHNITSLGIPYLTVSLRDGSADRLDQEWLAGQDGSREGLVRHISFTEPIIIKVDGAGGEGIAIYSHKEKKWTK
ncbi:MAG TPA: phosphoenolpyruvate synthase/pyruvate phosphate dikinase, partial [Desulfobacterales bacterium]|nr:phosphoenolpyruvate synthase/pyruvate phosphate dikinase [Desulfobacterales bacterium]